MAEHPDHEPNIESPSEDDTTRGATGRSYDCIFCKRGFTTAQALGGHMNIHRRDRGKMQRQTTPAMLADVEDHINNGLYWPHNKYSNFSPHFSLHCPATSASSRNYAGLPAPSSGVRAVDHEHLGTRTARRLRELRIFGSELGDMDGENIKRTEDEEEGGLDLELRLGRSYT